MNTATRLIASKTFSLILSTFVVAFALASDAKTSPLVLGKLILIHNQEPPVEIRLAPDQLESLSQWWRQQRPEWTQDYASASLRPEIVEMKLKHADGTIDEVTFKHGLDGRAFAELRTGHGGCGHWPVESICDQKKARWLTKSLSGEDLKSFWKAVKVDYPPGRRGILSAVESPATRQ